MKKAIYPGSFDPITNGHLDIIERTSKIFDHVTVAVAKNNKKNKFLFSDIKRKKFIEQSIKHLKNVDVKLFDGLLINFVIAEKSNIIIRGLRVLSDFEYEFRMALMNRNMNEAITTLFMMPHENYTHVSSSIIKEIATLNGKIDNYVPKEILNEIIECINDIKSS